MTPLRRTLDFNAGNINWQVAEVFDTTESDKINPQDPNEHPPALGAIRRITLIGGESVYDNIEIETTGGNPNPVTAGILVNPKKINVNLRSGLIRIAIVTDTNFDALSIDPTTVQLGNATTLINGFGGDIEPDGDTDLLLFFRFRDIGIVCGDTSVLFSARTLTGEMVEGIGVIETVGCP
ncbi:hypothetical protein L0222_18985 [bacterium]|nr:hypothetical protein [bacterium]MCI0602610.1 hypothetical protein [bacterium]